VSAQVVTADGRTRTCDARRDPDLFWALRGGGGGNFGVVTSFTFATHRTRDLTSFTAFYSTPDAARVFTTWQDWLPTLPDTIWAQAVFLFGDAPSSVSFWISGVCVGNESDLRPYWTRFLDDAAATPQYANVTTRSYRETMLGDACGQLSVSQCHLPGQTPDGVLERVSMAASSDYFDQRLPAAGVQAIFQALLARSASRHRGAALFDSMGGAIARVPPSATAFVHRRALYSVQYLAQYAVGAAAEVLDEAATWVHGMRAVAAPWSSGGAYQNYVDPLLTDWPSAYYGSNYPRLMSVKARYDPEAIFRFPQGIPPR
jgi:FAD/FMN-containing dehydrogenase